VLNYVYAASIDVLQKPRIVCDKIRSYFVGPYSRNDGVIHPEIARSELLRVDSLYINIDPFQRGRKVVTRPFNETDLERARDFDVDNFSFGHSFFVEESRLDVRIRQDLISLFVLRIAHGGNRLERLSRLHGCPWQCHLEGNRCALVFSLQIEWRV